MSKNKYFSGTRWIDQISGGMHVPCTDIIVWDGGVHLGGTYMEFSTCVRTIGNETHAIAFILKRDGEPFCFVAEGIMRQPYSIGAKTLEEAKAETEAKITAIVDAACSWARIPKYMVVRCSLHEGGTITSVGTFVDYNEAELAMAKDRKETANGWDEVDPDDVEIDDLSVSYRDERFIWDILPIA